MKVGLAALADLYQENAVRIACSATSIEGVKFANVEAAAHCFAVAAGLRAASGMEAREGRDAAERLDGEAATARPDAQPLEPKD